MATSSTLKILCATLAVCLFSGTTSAEKSTLSIEEYREIVRENAASNPHAVFDEDDLTGMQHTKCASENDSKDIIDATPSIKEGELEQRTAKLGDNPSVDWRKKGAVTPVKNQGAFGTCWSFAAAENLEGLNVRQGHKLQNISNQELIDCCKTCQGRSADASFDFLLNNTGGRIDTQASYPYKGNSTECKAKMGVLSTVQLKTHGRVHDDGTGKPIVAALMKYGPMGLGVDAHCFFGYKGGVITNCTKSAIDHAVLMVAAGTDTSTGKSIDYYTIKNSWGAKWGEEGYVRVQRGTPAQCGIGSTVWTM